MASARAAGVMTAGREIFLDDDPSPAAVAAQLEMLAREARRTGEYSLLANVRRYRL